MGWVGLEPTTFGLRIRCSDLIELPALDEMYHTNRHGVKRYRTYKRPH